MKLNNLTAQEIKKIDGISYSLFNRYSFLDYAITLNDIKSYVYRAVKLHELIAYYKILRYVHSKLVEDFKIPKSGKSSRAEINFIPISKLEREPVIYNELIKLDDIKIEVLDNKRYVKGRPCKNNHYVINSNYNIRYKNTSGYPGACVACEIEKKRIKRNSKIVKPETQFLLTRIANFNIQIS